MGYGSHVRPQVEQEFREAIFHETLDKTRHLAHILGVKNMGRGYDPGRATRERLLILERREKARAEASAVADGVAESVGLSRGRGAAFEKPATRKVGKAESGYRRLSGLEWLKSKGRLTDDQLAAGERYGAAFRKVEDEARIKSILDRDTAGGAGQTLSGVMKQAEARAQARLMLAMYRGQLLHQADLVAVCDLVCGRELTPREGSANGQEAARVEGVLKVALDLLTQHLAPVRERFSQDVAKAA